MGDQRGKASLMEDIIRHGELAYNPTTATLTRSENVVKFEELLSRTKVMALLPALTTLVQPGRVQTWLRPHLMRALAILPLRPRGVRNVIEFIVSAHPSTAPPPSTKGPSAETRGPTISLEALSSASKLISSPPSGMSPSAWFGGIAAQLLELLDGAGGLEMVKVSAYIIGYGILGRREYGAPGSAGWTSFALPMLVCIDPSLSDDHGRPTFESAYDEIINFSARNVLVSSLRLAEALRRLASLLSSHPNPGLSKRLLDHLLLPLWALSSWPATGKDCEDWRAPATYLLQILLQLSDDKKVVLITENLMFRGKMDTTRGSWVYKSAPREGIQVEKCIDDTLLDPTNVEDLGILDHKIETLIAILQPTRDESLVPTVFLSLCKTWLLSDDFSPPSLIVSSHPGPDRTADMEKSLIRAKIVQKMMDTMPSLLISDSHQVLELSSEVLRRLISREENLEDDETAFVALSLLNLVLASTKSQMAKDDSILASIKVSLDCIAKMPKSDLSDTAQNLSYLLEIKDAENIARQEPAVDEYEEQRRTYKLAMSYLMSTESPPPVRAQGLDLLLGVMKENSPILDIPATMIVLLSLLQDQEEYIYLRCVKAYIQLSIKHPKTVMESLLQRYVDADEETTLDVRLRIGEALLQVIEKAGESFTGPMARDVAIGLLNIAGRRGYRPKTEDAHKRRDAISRSKQREAEEAWDGEVPQLDPEAQEVGQEILEQIVGGWEGKKGEEDVRIRASALSIFGIASEVNIAGLGSTITSSGIDLSVNILAMEPEPSKAILRRSAILLVMSVIRALDAANPGFGFAGQNITDVVRILKYVESTDNDGLVRQHARDVIEGLETWQMKSVLQAASSGTQIPTLDNGLAGLSLSSTSSLKNKPRIEEID